MDRAASSRRRQAGATLQSFDFAFLRSALDAAPAIAWMTDSQLRVLQAFGKGLRTIGVVADEMVGKPLTEAFECGPTDEIVVGTSAALEGESRQFECVWADRMYEAEVRPVMNAQGRITGAFGIALDVTERNESADRLRRFTAAIDAANEAIVGVGTDGRIRIWNHGAEALFGFSTARVIGQQLAELFVERQQIQTVLDRVLEGESPVWRDMVWTSHFHHEARTVSVTFSASRNATNRVTGVTLVIRNEQPRSDKDIKLRQEKLDAVARLAGNVAHDFNNLLTVLQLYGELLRGQVPSHWPAQEDLAVIMKATRAAADLTRQLLAFSKQAGSVSE